MFWATVEYVAWIISIPLFLLIQWGAVWAISGDFWLSMLYLLTLPLFGKLALNLNDFYRKTLQQIKWVSTRKKARSRIKMIRQEIHTFFGQIA